MPNLLLWLLAFALAIVELFLDPPDLGGDHAPQ